MHNYALDIRLMERVILSFYIIRIYFFHSNVVEVGTREIGLE